MARPTVTALSHYSQVAVAQMAYQWRKGRIGAWFLSKHELSMKHAKHRPPGCCTALAHAHQWWAMRYCLA